MDFAKIIERVKAVLITPKTEWPIIAAEAETVQNLYKNYIFAVAALPAIASFIKGSLIGVSVLGISYRTPIFAGLIGMIVSYALSLGIVYLMALLIDALAPTFGGQKNFIQALKTAAYTYTASWVAGIAIIVPWLGWLIALAGAIYGIYLLYLGLPHTMRNPPEKSVGYTVLTVVIGFIVSLVAGAIVGMFAVSSGMGTAAMLSSSSSNVTMDANSAVGKLAAMGEALEAQGKKMEAAERSGDSKAQADAAGAMLGTVLGGGDQVEALSPDALKPFLPETLGALQRESISVERNAAMGMQISTGNAVYGDDQGNRIDLEITDLGSAKGIMALAGFAGVEVDRQTSTGYEKTYKKDGNLISERWDNESRDGEFSIVVGERFAVKLNGRGNTMDIERLKAAITSLDLAKLESLKHQGVKRS